MNFAKLSLSRNNDREPEASHSWSPTMLQSTLVSTDSKHSRAFSITSNDSEGSFVHRTYTGDAYGMLRTSGTVTREHFSLAEFRLADKYPRKQRKRLLKLQSALPQEPNGIKAPPVKPKKDKREKSSGTAMNKLGALLKHRKAKSRSVATLMHSLRLALVDGRLEIATKILDQIPAQTIKKKCVEESNYIFLLAISKRHESIAMKFYEKGYPPDVNTPIFVPNTATAVGETPKFQFPTFFTLTVGFGLTNLASAMLKKADVNRAWYGMTPLMLASCIVDKGSASLVQELLDQGADPSVSITLEHFHLHRKLCTRASRIRSASIGTSTNVSRSPSFGDSTMPFKTGLSSNLLMQYGQTALNLLGTQEKYNAWSSGKFIFPLDMAACYENIETIHILLKRMNQMTTRESTFCFLVQRDLYITLQLWKYGGNFNMCNWSNLNGLHIAARSGALNLVLVYLETPIDINAGGENGWTALHEAISYGHIDIVRALVRKGAKIDVRTTKNETPREVGLRTGIKGEEIDAWLDPLAELTATEKQQEQAILDLIAHTLMSSPIAPPINLISTSGTSLHGYERRDDSIFNIYSSGVGPNGQTPSTVGRPKKSRRSTLDKLVVLKQQVFSRNNPSSSLFGGPFSLSINPQSPLSPLGSRLSPLTSDSSSPVSDNSPGLPDSSHPRSPLGIGELAIK